MVGRLISQWQRMLGLSGFSAGLSVLLMLSVALNLTLAYRLHAATAPRASSSRALKLGQIVGPLIAETRVGTTLQAQRYEPHGDRRTLIYASSAQCKWSQQNLPTFVELARQLQRTYRIVAIDVTPDLKDKPSHLDVVPGALVLRNLTPETLETYRIIGTPQTVVISPESKVDRMWVGAYLAQTATEVDQYFHVRLTPTLQPAPASMP